MKLMKYLILSLFMHPLQACCWRTEDHVVVLNRAIRSKKLISYVNTNRLFTAPNSSPAVRLPILKLPRSESAPPLVVFSPRSVT